MSSKVIYSLLSTQLQFTIHCFSNGMWGKVVRERVAFHYPLGINYSYDIHYFYPISKHCRCIASLCIEFT